MAVLIVKKLTKAFPMSEMERKSLGIKEKRKTAVDGVSFEIQSGNVFGLLGPNGAGKTTIMRMLATLLKPDSGTILYDDISAEKYPEKVRSMFAFLTTELKLDPKATPNEMFDFFSELYHVPKSIAMQRKEVLFSKFGIHEFAEKRISKLSQGMKQKISLAISVLHDPQFIIFDEPTNGLDVIVAKDVREFILEMKQEGKCLIVSTHLFDLIEKVCDQVALIVDGKIIKNDNLERIMDGKSMEEAFYDIYTEHLQEKQEVMG